MEIRSYIYCHKGYRWNSSTCIFVKYKNVNSNSYVEIERSVQNLVVIDRNELE